MNGVKTAFWERRVFGVAGVLGGFLVLAPAAAFCLKHSLAWPCPVWTLLHFPCPSCGSTRALAALSRLDFLAALRFNPLFTLSGPICLMLLFVRVPAGLNRAGWPLLFGALFLNWIYLLLFLPR